MAVRRNLTEDPRAMLGKPWVDFMELLTVVCPICGHNKIHISNCQDDDCRVPDGPTTMRTITFHGECGHSWCLVVARGSGPLTAHLVENDWVENPYQPRPCIRCGRPLRQQESVATGLGPCCAAIIGRENFGQPKDFQTTMNEVLALMELHNFPVVPHATPLTDHGATGS